MTATITTLLPQQKENWFNSDSRFDKLYPLPIRRLGERHWTPLEVAESAALFLAAEKGVRILDIGSGVGKFCLSAAHYKPDALYYGVEQRKDLVTYAESAKQILNLSNVSFIHENFTKLDFKQYDHFYFYNSFYENLTGIPKIDESITYSSDLFNFYNRNLYRQLAKRPSGTRVAGYHSLEVEMPRNYHVVGSDMDGLLKFWIKE